MAIIQARMGSSRLPGKIMAELAGKSVLRRVVERVSASGAFDEVVVATSTLSQDDVTAKEAASYGARVVRGSETDVLARFHLAAQATGATSIARITSDCPLIDPDILAQMAEKYASGDFDYLSNTLTRSYPRGLDAEFFSRTALEQAHSDAISATEREHVTPFLYSNPELFRLGNFPNAVDQSKYRLTLDTPEDLRLLEHIYDASSAPDALRLAEAISLLEENPDWVTINAGIHQKGHL